MLRQFALAALLFLPWRTASHTDLAVHKPAPSIAREFRGVWVSPVSGADWPSRPGLPPDSQRAEMRRILDRAQQLGLNAVILHVRTAADALYPTPNAPWSPYLTGALGKAPSPFYDPLEFAIREAHARGLELHAWFNPFRAAPPDFRIPRSEMRVQQSWLVKYGSQTWIDPGIPDARASVLEAIMDVVNRYDIDGIHLDDYFYPYLEDGAGPFADTASWRRFGVPDGWEVRADWRRDNINKFVSTLYREVKARKPSVRVGISPFGIWRPGHPEGITGLDSYAEIFADSRLWLQKGWVDYLAPQLYWPLDGKQDRFRKLDEWWRSQNSLGRQVWPGLHTDLEFGRNRWPSGEIERQIEFVRNEHGDDAAGHIHFRMRDLMSLPLLYATPALPPAMPWIDSRIPAAPRVIRDTKSVRISPATDVPLRWLAVQSLQGDRWSLRLYPATATISVAPADRVVVTAVSEAGLTSEPAE